MFKNFATLNNKIGTLVKKNYKLILILFILFIFYRPVQVLLEQKDYLINPGFGKQYEEYRRLYYSSQFVQKENPNVITDEVFRSFAGGAFLKGLNPILITHDHPPLGNYMIAASIFFFDNPRTLMIPILSFIALGIYLLSRKVLDNSLLALIPLGIFVNESLFLNKMLYVPLIEPIQFPFILFAFYFFIKAMEEKRYIKWFVLTSIFLGIIISTRYFVTGGIMVFCMVSYLAYERRRIDKKLVSFIFTLPISLIILVGSYTRTLMDGYSVIDVFRIQKYIFVYHKSKFILPFSFWDLLLFNRWHTWWGDWRISSDPQWLITWPVSFILAFVHLIFGLFRKLKLNKAEKILIIWLGVYTLTLSTGYSSTNYFLSIIPFLYILATSFVYKLYIFLFLKSKR